MKTVAFVAVKGGVGKTRLSIDVALRLMQRNNKVAYVDADFDNANFAQFTNTNAEQEIWEGKGFTPFNWNGLQVFSMSLVAGRERSISMTGDRYGNMLDDVLNKTQWDADIFIVDLPAGSSDVFKAAMVVFGDSIAGNIIISQPSMTDALHRVLNLHKYFEIPILGIIDNMAYFEADGKTYYPFGRGKTEAIAQKFDVALLSKIPLSEKISERIESGSPTLDKDYQFLLDKPCEAIEQAKTTKISLAEKVKTTIIEKVQEVVAKALVQIITSVQSDFDVSGITKKAKLIEQRPFEFTITDESFKKEIVSLSMKVSNSAGLRVLKNPEKVDFHVATDFRTFSRMILRKKKFKDKFYPFDALDAWLNGDLKVYGVGHSPKVVQAIRSIFFNDELMDEVTAKYGKILENWI